MLSNLINSSGVQTEQCSSILQAFKFCPISCLDIKLSRRAKCSWGCILCGSVVRNLCHVLLQKPCIFVYSARLPYCQNSRYNNLLTVMWLCIWMTSSLSHNVIFTKTVENLFFIYLYYTQHICNEIYVSLLLY